VSNEVIDWLSCLGSSSLIVLIQDSRWLWLNRFGPEILEGTPDQHDGVETRKIVEDMQSSSLRLPPADGILMANTLHFVQEQRELPQQLRDRFTSEFVQIPQSQCLPS
jgi:hypothetical protein